MAGRPDPQLGVIRDGDAAYGEYRTFVDRITEGGFVLLPV
jgi:hypothetical protein